MTLSNRLVSPGLLSRGSPTDRSRLLGSGERSYPRSEIVCRYNGHIGQSDRVLPRNIPWRLLAQTNPLPIAVRLMRWHRYTVTDEAWIRAYLQRAPVGVLATVDDDPAFLTHLIIRACAVQTRQPLCHMYIASCVRACYSPRPTASHQHDPYGFQLQPCTVMRKTCSNLACCFRAR